MPAFSGLFNDGLSPQAFPLNTTGPRTGKTVREALANVTVGANAGATATANRTQIKGTGGNNDLTSGKVVLEVAADINRATTATDVANLKAQLSRQNVSSFGFVRDLSGNGGPAYTRSF